MYTDLHKSVHCHSIPYAMRDSLKLYRVTITANCSLSEAPLKNVPLIFVFSKFIRKVKFVSTKVTFDAMTGHKFRFISKVKAFRNKITIDKDISNKLISKTKWSHLFNVGPILHQAPDFHYTISPPNI